MVVPFHESFQFCPRCGTEAEQIGQNPFRCSNCDHTFYFGPTVAVGGILSDEQGRILLIRRARDPGKGKYGLPGGFVDPGESGEDAVARETYEEVGLKATSIEYLATFENSYTYRGIVSPVLDIFYVCKTQSLSDIKNNPEEVSEYEFCIPGPEQLDNMAFQSNRRALELYLSQQQR